MKEVLIVNAGYYVSWFVIHLHFVFVLVVVFVPGIIFFVFSVSCAWFCCTDVAVLPTSSCSHVGFVVLMWQFYLRLHVLMLVLLYWCDSSTYVFMFSCWFCCTDVTVLPTFSCSHVGFVVLMWQFYLRLHVLMLVLLYWCGSSTYVFMFSCWFCCTDVAVLPTFSCSHVGFVLFCVVVCSGPVLDRVACSVGVSYFCFLFFIMGWVCRKLGFW
jgi:hypothetical protein